MTAFLQACIEANRVIYQALQQGFDTQWYEKHDVGAGGDVSSALDLMAESVFVEYLSPFGEIESEESGVIGSGAEKIIIDPIDGTSNALSLFPFYGTSVAKVNAAGILDTAVVVNLGNGDLFFKLHGEVLYHGKLESDSYTPVEVAAFSEVGLFEKAYANPTLVQALDKEGLKFRSPGAIALSLAYAHSVSYVLFVGTFRIYDFAAGLALCEGLEVIVESDYVIVSKDKETAAKIERLIQNQGC